MGLPVTVYRWDDAGAPQLTNRTPAEIIAIVKACLVTGYGAKAGAGWSVAFEDAATYQLALRNNTVNGSGGFLHLYSLGAANATGGAVIMAAAKSMSALGVYVGRSYLRATYAGLSSNTRWYIVATSRGFYLHLITNNNTIGQSTYEIMTFCGDIESTLANDAGQFLLIQHASGADDTSVLYVESFSYIDGGSVLGRIYDADGASNTTLFYLGNNFNRITSTLTGSASENGTQHFLQKIWLFAQSVSSLDRLGIYTCRSTISPYLRGAMPGIVMSTFAGYSDKTWPVIESFNGVNHLGVRNGANITMWLNTVSWYD